MTGNNRYSDQKFDTVTDRTARFSMLTKRTFQFKNGVHNLSAALDWAVIELQIILKCNELVMTGCGPTIAFKRIDAIIEDPEIKSAELPKRCLPRSHEKRQSISSTEPIFSSQPWSLGHRIKIIEISMTLIKVTERTVRQTRC
jgi:hypothetical protein